MTIGVRYSEVASIELAEAQLRVCDNNFGEIKSAGLARTFSIRREAHDMRAQTKSYLKHSFRRKKPDSIRRRFLKTVTYTSLALAAAACGVRNAIPVPTETAPTGTPAATEQVMPTFPKDMLLQSFGSWKEFHHGPTNISMTGDPAPYTDPKDPSHQSLYLMETASGDGTMYSFSSVPIEAARSGNTKNYNMPAVTRLNADGSVQTFGLIEISPSSSDVEQFLVESLAPDGSLQAETWVLQITHLTNGKDVYSIISADGKETPLGYAGSKSSDQAQEGLIYNAVFRVGGIEAIPTSAMPEYKGVPLYTIDEAKQLILEQGSMSETDRVLSSHHAGMLASFIIKPDPNDSSDPAIISHDGINEKRVDISPTGEYTMWFNNRLLINGKKVDSTLIFVVATPSSHSIIVFKNKQETPEVLVLDSVFPQEERRPDALP